MPRRTAFTLVELLVVVAIIVALLAILMPSMGKAIGTAQLAACASNNRQIGLASTMHLADRKRMFPLAGQIADFSISGAATDYLEQWNDGGTMYPMPIYAALGRYMSIKIRSDSRANLQTDVQNAQLMNVYACPAQDQVVVGQTLANNGWQAPFERTSYGFNEAVFGNQSPHLRIRGSANRIVAASNTLMFADSKPREDDGSGVHWVAYYNHDSNGSTSMLNVWQNLNAGRANQIDEERHAGKMSATFADGHAAAIKITPDDLDAVYLSRGLK